MVELQLFYDAPSGPTATESALVDWVTNQAKRQYNGYCPRQWYDALLAAATRIANPSWKDLTDFPSALATRLLTAHEAMYRTMQANYVTEAPTHELRARLKAIQGRRRRPGADEWYEDLVERLFIQEELAERAILTQASDDRAL